MSVVAGENILQITNNLQVDTINEYTAASGVAIDGVLQRDGMTRYADVVAPANPGNGFGLVYKETSLPGLYYRSQASGAARRMDTTYDDLAPTTTFGDITVYSGGTNVRFGVGTDGYVLSSDSTAPNGISWISTANLASSVITTIVRQELPTGTNGGTFTANAWQTRSLNTLFDTSGGNMVIPSQSGIALDTLNNRIVVPPGVYFFIAMATSYRVGNNQARLISVGECETAKFLAVADVAGSLAGKYFLFSTPAVGYYVWYRVSGVGVDPAVAGRTGILVNISTGDSSAAVASATATALNGSFNLTASNPRANQIYVRNLINGNATDAAAGTSGFTTTVEVQGSSYGRPQVSTFTTVSGATLNSRYFLISSPHGAFAVWYNIASGLDPGIVGYTSFPITTVLAGDTAAQVATKTTTALNASLGGYFTTTNLVAGQFVVRNVQSGPVLASTVGTSGFTVALTQAGTYIGVAGVSSFTATVATTLGGRYILFSHPLADYYVWYNTGASVDPAVAGRIGIQVSGITPASTAAAVATATFNAINAAAPTLFTATNPSAGVFVITNLSASTAISPPTIGTTSFTLTITVSATSSGCQVSTITTVADVAGSLNNKYILIDVPVRGYYIWFNVGGLGVDPRVAGRTGRVVSFATNSTAAVIATAINTAINTSLSAVFVSRLPTTTRVAVETVQPGATAAVSAGNSGFTIATRTLGIGGLLAYGTSQIAKNNAQSAAVASTVYTQYTFNATSSVELQHFCNTTTALIGFGEAAGVAGATEIFSHAIIYRLAPLE